MTDEGGAGRAAFILLAHENLAAAGALARALLANGRAVAVHIDPRAGALDEFQRGAGEGAIMLPRIRAEWGMFGLVEATLAGAAALLSSGRSFSHVVLVSGADLPLRPLAELDLFLNANSGADLIEAEVFPGPPWFRDGLGMERFTLRHPFPWRRRRRLFDASVAVQRRLGLRRRTPRELKLALGSQWWALSRETLAKILADPDLRALKRFWRWVWIPDESFFQTLTLRHSRRLIGLSPTFARFDERGAPYVFHDDHTGLLASTDHFFARKIHPRAASLRAALLEAAQAPACSGDFRGWAPETAIVAARESRTMRREALISPARLSGRRGGEKHSSPVPYLVIGGVGTVMAARISGALSARGALCHGRIFGPEAPAFADGALVAAGGAPASAAARDLWPEQFVINLARGAAMASLGRPAFCFSVEDRFAIGDFIAADPGARVLWWRGGWALDLLDGADPLDQARARQMAVAERGMLATLRRGGAALEVCSAGLLATDGGAASAAMRRALNAPVASQTRLAGPEPDFRPLAWAKARAAFAVFSAAGAEVEAELILAAAK